MDLATKYALFVAGMALWVVIGGLVFYLAYKDTDL